MPCHWDRPLLPTVGDASEDDTHIGVGRIIDTWEVIEFDMCVLMAALNGDMSWDAMKLYGESRNFTERIADFARAAKRHFIRRPDQEREGRLNSLIDQIEQFSKRRNEVAHSIVMRINQIEYFRLHLTNQSTNVDQYAAIPPYHMIRGHDTSGLPM